MMTEEILIENILLSDLVRELDNEDLNEAIEELESIRNELIILEENEILNEGKIMNKIRWKIAMFSLRFLSNNFLNDFFEEYYNDENGNPTKESVEWIKKPRREKIKKIREFANRLPDEVKDQIANSREAKAFESKGGTDLLFSGISGLGLAGGAVAVKQTLNSVNSVKQTRDFLQGGNVATTALSLLSVLLSAIGGLLGAAIWTTFISSSVMTGINVTKAGINYRKAITIRRDEITNILKHFKDKNEIETNIEGRKELN